MQKRSEANKKEKIFFRTKLKHTAIIVLCMLFALSTIYAVDISTYKLKENENDRYAIRVLKANYDTLRIDFVGNKYNVDIKNIRAYAEKLTEKTGALVKEFKNILR